MIILLQLASLTDGLDTNFTPSKDINYRKVAETSLLQKYKLTFSVQEASILLKLFIIIGM